MIVAGCQADSDASRVIYITATPIETGEAITAIPSQPPVPVVQPTVVAQQSENLPALTPDPIRAEVDAISAEQHTVQSGDTLFGIAQNYGVSLDAILAVNQLSDPNALFVGQVINLPGPPSEQTPDFKIVPDSRMVRGPDSANFDVAGFIASQPGIITTVTDEVSTRLSDGSEQEDILTASQIVERVALEFSVDPRLLLAILEHEASWLSRMEIEEEKITHPILSETASAGIDRAGLYRQLTWTANMLNFGYYGWKVRGWTTVEFDDQRLLYAPGLNAGSVAVQYMLSRVSSYTDWQSAVSSSGLYETYLRYFGDPFENALDPLVPTTLGQPDMTLPFAQGETWFYTGGAHGGWGSGSAWAAVDFAPPDEPPSGVFCYTSEYWTTAVAPGLIVRSNQGTVVLDLDGDGDETTGWTVLYLHIATDGRVTEGTYVNAGDRIGRPSCEGGFSTATHMHIARRFNGEWIPAYCHACSEIHQRPIFNMGGWEVIGLRNQEYQGYLERGGERRIAEQGRLNPNNRISW